jgi:hypothetical protein
MPSVGELAKQAIRELQGHSMTLSPPHASRAGPAASFEAKNLILVTHPGRQDWRDFEAIGQEIAKLAPEICGYIVSPDDAAQSVPREAWSRRSLIVSFGPLGRFTPPRGRVFQSAWIPKYEQYLLFAAAGVPMPFTSVFRVGRPFDCSKHRALVVAKPTKIGAMSHGDQVVLMRCERVQDVVPARFPPELTSEEAPIIIQDFIDPGARAQIFRVLVLFGAALLCYRVTADDPRPELDAPDAKLEIGRVASNAPGRAIEFVADLEVIEFAKAASQAIPWIPLLGFDIVRESTTGALYVLESNPGGNTWIFSSHAGIESRAIAGGAELFKNQFGAWEVAARALIQATRRYAR